VVVSRSAPRPPRARECTPLTRRALVYIVAGSHWHSRCTFRRRRGDLHPPPNLRLRLRAAPRAGAIVPCTWSSGGTEHRTVRRFDHPKRSTVAATPGCAYRSDLGLRGTSRLGLPVNRQTLPGRRRPNTTSRSRERVNLRAVRLRLRADDDRVPDHTLARWSFTDFEYNGLASIPISERTVRVDGCTSVGSSPALVTSKRSPPRFRSSASAI
jgi:hypothetical protein